MRISVKALAAAKRRLGTVEPKVEYIKPDKSIVIGGIILHRSPTETTTDRIEIYPLDSQPASVECELVREGTSGKLYWVTVTQGAGTVLYQWTNPGGRTFSFLACASALAELRVARRDTNLYIKRRRMLLRLMVETGYPEADVNRVCGAAGNELGLARKSLALVRLLLARHDPTAAREAIDAMINDPRSRKSQTTLTRLGIASYQEPARAAVFRGTRVAIPRDE